MRPRCFALKGVSVMTLKSVSGRIASPILTATRHIPGASGAGITTESAVAVSVAALRHQNCELDEDVANVPEPSLVTAANEPEALAEHLADLGI